MNEPAYSVSRLRGFSDAVFAIAITITVLQLVVPERELQETSVLQELAAQWPVFLSLAIGFVVVGYYWLNHHQLFELLDRADGAVVWLNLLLLLFVVFMPYPTEMLGIYHELPASFVFFHLISTVIGAINSLLWFYATSASRLVPDTLSPQALRVYRWRSVVIPGAFAVACVAAFAATWLSLLCLLLIVPGRLLVRQLVGTVPADETRREDLAAVQEDLEVGGAVAEGSSILKLLGGRSISSLDRLIAFTDGVYAIAITLLGLQFEPPERHIQTNAELVDHLLGIGRPLVSDLYWGYAIGFLVIGLSWVLHHRYFVVIRAQDGMLRVLNLVMLFFVALLPDATEFLSVHSGDPAALSYFALVAGCAGLATAAMWRWASRGHRLVDPALPDAAIRATLRLSLVMPAAFLLSIPLTVVVGAWAQLIWWVALVALRLHVHRRRSLLSA